MIGSRLTKKYRAELLQIPSDHKPIHTTHTTVSPIDKQTSFSADQVTDLFPLTALSERETITENLDTNILDQEKQPVPQVSSPELQPLPIWQENSSQPDHEPINTTHTTVSPDDKQTNFSVAQETDPFPLGALSERDTIPENQDTSILDQETQPVTQVPSAEFQPVPIWQEDSPQPTGYTNTLTLLLEEVSKIPENKLLVLENIAFDIDELVQHIVSKHGNFVDPYTNREYHPDEIRKILNFPEAYPILNLNLTIEQQFRNVPVSAGKALKQLAVSLSKDYNQQDGYAASKSAMEVFALYFSSLAKDQQTHLENCVIIYKDTSKKPPISVRSTFKSVFNDLATGEFCNHIAAVYFWILAAKIDPTIGPIPSSIAFTSKYWGGLIEPRTL